MKVADHDLYSIVSESMKSKQPRRAIAASTGLVSLDAALGGGLPSGSTEIYGEASVGKTTLLCHMIARAQNDGKLVALCPSEYLDIPYLRSFGIDLNTLILLTGNYSEDVLSAALLFLQDHRDYPCMLAMDSATSLRPERDIPGVWLSVIDLFLSHVNELLNEESSLVMVNQVRVKRSVDPHKFFAGGTDSTARKVAGHFSARLELFRSQVTESSYNLVVNTVANSFGIPSTLIELPVTKGKGIDADLDLVRLAVSRGVIERSGSWFKIAGVEQSTLGVGELAAVKSLQEFPDLRQYILDQLSKGL